MKLNNAGSRIIYDIIILRERQIFNVRRKFLNGDDESLRHIR